MPGVRVSETQCSLEKFSGWSQCFLSWQSQRAVPQWKVLDSSSVPVWENTHPTLSLLRHWCSMWKIKSVAHGALSPPSPYSNINMYDSVWWGRERLGEIEEKQRKGENHCFLWPNSVDCIVLARSTVLFDLGQNIVYATWHGEKPRKRTDKIHNDGLVSYLFAGRSESESVL